jgi:hypothetical protein
LNAAIRSPNRAASGLEGDDMPVHDRIVEPMKTRARRRLPNPGLRCASATILLVAAAACAAPRASTQHEPQQQQQRRGSEVDAERVTCRVAGDADERVYVLHGPGTSADAGSSDGTVSRRADGWHLAMRSRRTSGQWIRLALPGARPEIAPGRVRLSYRNANGGRHVDLAVDPDAATLEVWVDHGLEVDIEPDLDPRVDLMNTDGRLERLDCIFE